MEAFLVIVMIIAAVLIIASKKLKSIPEDQLTPENKKFLNAENNLKDTVQIGYDRIKKATQKKITEQYLVGGNWYLDNDELNVIYTFRSGGEILITEQGIVKKGNYEFIVDNNSIIITSDGTSKMFHIENIKNDIFILKELANNSILTFYNQTKIKDNIVKEIKKVEKQQQVVDFKSQKDLLLGMRRK